MMMTGVYLIHIGFWQMVASYRPPPTPHHLHTQPPGSKILERRRRRVGPELDQENHCRKAP